MGKIILPFLCMLLLFPTATSGSEPEGLKCPNPDVLMKTTEKDKDELSQALADIIPKVYGSKKKLLIAKSLCEKAHLYIWDEPLNFIDIYSRMQIEELIKSSHLTMVIVEHDQAFQQTVATKTIAMS